MGLRRIRAFWIQNLMATASLKKLQSKALHQRRLPQVARQIVRVQWLDLPLRRDLHRAVWMQPTTQAIKRRRHRQVLPLVRHLPLSPQVRVSWARFWDGLDANPLMKLGLNR